VGLRAGLDWCGKSRPTGNRSPDRPARRQSLYRLRYQAHYITVHGVKTLKKTGKLFVNLLRLPAEKDRISELKRSVGVFHTVV